MNEKNNLPKFSCSVLMKKLENVYGSKQRKDKLVSRDSQDLSRFLKKKEQEEKKSYKTKMLFK